jgi:hypothetical protein
VFLLTEEGVTFVLDGGDSTEIAKNIRRDVACLTGDCCGAIYIRTSQTLQETRHKQIDRSRCTSPAYPNSGSIPSNARSVSLSSRPRLTIAWRVVVRGVALFGLAVLESVRGDRISLLAFAGLIAGVRWLSRCCGRWAEASETASARRS